MKIKLHKHIKILFLLLLLPPLSIKAQDTLVYTADQTLLDVGQHVFFYKDETNALSFEQIKNLPDAAFQKSKTSLLRLGNTTASIWLKITVKNQTESPLFLAFKTDAINILDAFIYDEAGKLTTKETGFARPPSNRDLRRSNVILNIGQSPKVLYIKVKSRFVLQLPLVLARLEYLHDDYHPRDVLNGLGVGILVAMALYNLFIFFSIKDRLYLYYCLYVLASLWVIAHLSSIGWLIWMDYPKIAGLVGIPFVLLTAWLFTVRFLDIDKNMPRIYMGIKIFCLIIACIIPIDFLDVQLLRATIQQICTPLSAFSMLVIGIFSHFQGNKSARYFVLAWVFLVVGAIITSFSFAGFIPHNYYTIHAVLLGACIESILLAFALANRINIYREDSAKSQALAMLRLEEKEQLVREQNQFLEQKVNERTEALQTALIQIKNTESQLVQSEKMAALGELTAGIAHEINNPVNFITTSLLPLRRNLKAFGSLIDKYEALLLPNFAEKKKDIEDYKTEIDYDYTKEETALLLNSISDGANRTAEIVKGLRSFSRLDEVAQKQAQINDGLESTLLLMQSAFKKKSVQLTVDLGKIPEINCYEGQLNQVFMNILTNAVQALSDEGSVMVKTFLDSTGDNIKISIRDTGKGMTEATKNKIFQPFFTTKDVGEGTGLGLSISYGIVKKHNGTIEVETELDIGTVFTITLPVGEKLLK